MPPFPSHFNSSSSSLKLWSLVLFAGGLYSFTPDTFSKMPPPSLPHPPSPPRRCTGTCSRWTPTLFAMLKGRSSISCDSSLPPHGLSLLASTRLFHRFRASGSREAKEQAGCGCCRGDLPPPGVDSCLCSFKVIRGSAPAGGVAAACPHEIFMGRSFSAAFWQLYAWKYIYHLSPAQQCQDI